MHIVPNLFLLSTFGANNTYKAIHTIRRSIWIFAQISLKNGRIVTGLFAALLSIKLNSHTNALHVKIPKEWN
jgi:hypothetical protein